MPRDNFGFKGTALTPAQAYAAGASVSSQEYQYAVQLGVVTPVPEPPTGATFTALSVPSNSHGRTLTGVGTSTATLSKTTTSGFNQHIDLTISAACVMLWQGVNGPADNSSGGMMMYTPFPMYAGHPIEKAGNYATEVTIWGRYRDFCYPLPQAGTIRLVPVFGPSIGIEGTVTLVPAPAILYASANASSSGRRNFWTHSGGKHVTFTSNSYALEEFTFTLAANATVTITRTASAQWYTRLESNRFMAGAELDKYGTYSLVFPASASSTTSSVALLAGNYKYANVPSGVQVTFSIP